MAGYVPAALQYCLRRGEMPRLIFMDWRENMSYTHGLSGTRIYHIWEGIKKRCYNQNEKCYCHYGGRGIIVCDEWEDDFLAFYRWAMANGYSDELTIDRIDNDGNYEPSNCRWATTKEQSTNRRNNQYVTYDGQRITIKELSEKTGISYPVLRKRIVDSEWDIEKAISADTKVGCRKIIEYNGEKKSIAEFARQYGVPYIKLHQRITYLGWSMERALHER